MARVLYGAVLATVATGLGCTGGSARARLELQNNTGSRAGSVLSSNSLAAVHPASIALSSTRYFAMKLGSIYLAEDIDAKTQNNTGQAPMLWVNPHCTSADDCELFNFARPTATVNADLNSQQLDVAPGTYRYIRMEFCYHGERPTQPNIEWQGGAMTSPHGFLEMMCGVTSAAFDPPLVLQPGDTVSVALGYDLSDATSEGPPDHPNANGLTADDGHGIGFNDCVVDGAGTTKTCFNVPSFAPSAIKNGSAPGDPVTAPMTNDGGSGDGG